jgi:hypothetical protein
MDIDQQERQVIERIFNERLTALEKWQATMSADVVKLTEAMTRNTIALEDWIELGKGLKFGMKVLTAIQKIAIWVASVAGACGILYGVWVYAVKKAIEEAAK